LLKAIIDRYCRFLGHLMVAALALMVILVFGNVVMRYGFNSGFTVSEELSRWLFVWMTFMGAIVALHERSHLGTDTVVSRLSNRGKRICLGLSYVLMLYICWLLYEGGLAQTKINWASTSPVMEASMGIFNVSGVVFAVSGAVILLHNLWRLISGQIADSELIGVIESEDTRSTQL
jgi:TRAP-type transport system small permease protein